MSRLISFSNAYSISPHRETFLTATLICAVCFSLVACTNGKETEKAKTKVPHSKNDLELDAFILPLPKKKSRDEVIKKYMKEGKESSRWQDYNKAADLASDLNDYSSAEILLNQSLKLNPNQAATYKRLGHAKYSALDDRNDSARKDFEKAIQLGDNDKETFEMLANIYAAANQPEKAIEILSKGIKICRKKVHLYHARAAIYLTQNNQPLALKDYSALLKIRPDYVRGYVARGQLYEKLGEPEKALLDYNQILSLKEDDIFESHIIAYEFKASLLDKLNRNEEAIRTIETAIKSFPDNDELYELLGEQELKTQKYTKAIDSFTRSIKIDPKYARRAYEGRSKAHKALGNKDLAKQDAKKAQSLKEAPAEKQLYRYREKKK